jgi:large repetitive protein
VVVADGSLQSGQIVINSSVNSGENVYDAAGDIEQYTSIVNGQTITQKGFYNTQGELTLLQTQTTTGGAFYTEQTGSYDADGHLTQSVVYNVPGTGSTSHTEAGTSNGSVVTFTDTGWVQSDTVYRTYNRNCKLPPVLKTDTSAHIQVAASAARHG